MRTLIVVLALALSQAAAANDVALDPGANGRIQEFVVGVTDLDRALPLFTDVLKWRVIARGTADASVARVWGLPVETPVAEALVGNPGSAYGFVRLVQVDLPERAVIRAGANWWDTGGAFALNFFVADLDATMAGLVGHGFVPTGEPVAYGDAARGEGSGRMTRMAGPDGLVLSFQERLAPPLTGWPAFDGASHVENAMEVVRDLNAWSAFAGRLGLGTPQIMDRAARAAGPGAAAMGLPRNAIDLSRSRQAILRLGDTREQMLTAWQFKTAEGTDASARVKPQNLGVTGLRIPVKDATALYAAFKQAGADIAAELQVLRLAPYGTTRAFAVVAPGGSGLRVELIEPNATPMGEADLRAFTRQGRYATWIRFNNRLTGSIHWRADGTARVKWDEGGLDEEGTWTIRGDAVCTAWFKLRAGRELCVHHYRLAGDTTQSFTVDGRTDGIYAWQAAGIGP
ncbi:MAG: hypothetical protein SFV21_09040 [Rhodospirillaceae bacterium]|nr:hypothetical protein [Rhodospirillaceae bacterium]